LFSITASFRLHKGVIQTPSGTLGIASTPLGPGCVDGTLVWWAQRAASQRGMPCAQQMGPTAHGVHNRRCGPAAHREAAITNMLRKPWENWLGQTQALGEEACLGDWVCHAHSQFENRLRSKDSPQSLSCVALPDITTQSGALEPSYPEGNFEGNQLLGGSIGLSPLCHTQATQFARQNSD